ncbi:MAG: hypothetical protein K1000chlam3_00464 [Chlamydiae bacterium]|nr:hypothetical protein [Chlamydiota bacterium]
MVRLLSLLLLAVSSYCMARENLDSHYCVSYGDPSAKIHITEYFSFSCPQCVRLFNKDFSEIKKQHIESGKVYWTFHPIPVDIPTIQAMVCLEKLNPKQKEIFLEAILSESQKVTTEQMTILMQKGLEILGYPLPDLDKQDFLKQTKAFRASFAYISQEDMIAEVPTYEINGNLQIELPEKKIIDQKIKEHEVISKFAPFLSKGEQS